MPEQNSNDNGFNSVRSGSVEEFKGQDMPGQTDNKTPGGGPGSLPGAEQSDPNFGWGVGCSPNVR